MASQDMSQLMGIFLDEGREQLSLLETSFLDLERTSDSHDLLQDLFRAAHTLKGSSRAMGFNAMGDLTHKMEDVLDSLRNGLISVSADLVTAMLAGLDQLKDLMDQIEASGADTIRDPESFSVVVARLAGLLSAETPAAKADTPVVSLSLPDGEGSVVEVKLSNACQMKGVRAMMVLSMAETLGHVEGTMPEREKLDEEEFEFSFLIRVSDIESMDELLKKLSLIPEVESASLFEGGSGEGAMGVTPFSAEGPLAGEGATPVAPGNPLASKPGATAPASGRAASATIRVGIDRLDKLMNLVGELVTDRTQIANLCLLMQQRHQGDELVARLNDVITRVSRVTSELQDEVMKTRMLPIDNVFQRMPRVVRDLAQTLGKEIDLQISGGDTEIDRSLIDALSDPLIHLLRNCVDHGVEMPDARGKSGKPTTGTVRLSARHEENHIVIEISDDGGGIDAEKLKNKALSQGLMTETAVRSLSEADAIRLIFAAGLSTAKEVSAFSGRGVGMDIVKTNLEKIGGQVNVESQLGKGTKFTIQLPLTLAIMRSLLVGAGNVTYALPLACVLETLRLGASAGVRMESVNGMAVMPLCGRNVSLSGLSDLLEDSKSAGKASSIPKDATIVVVGAGSQLLGLCVDQLKGEQEVVIKPLGSLLGDVHGISGASILGDGSVALIVDPGQAVNLAA